MASGAFYMLSTCSHTDFSIRPERLQTFSRKTPRQHLYGEEYRRGSGSHLLLTQTGVSSPTCVGAPPEPALDLPLRAGRAARDAQSRSGSVLRALLHHWSDITAGLQPIRPQSCPFLRAGVWPFESRLLTPICFYPWGKPPPSAFEFWVGELKPS